MLLATFRHADNFRDRRILDIGISDLGRSQAASVSRKAVPFFQDNGPVLAVSSGLLRGEQTRDILANTFREAGIDVTSASAPCINAKTHEDYLAFIDMIMNLPKYCIMSGIKLPQAIILVTHAHNIVGHMAEQLADARYHAKTPEALAEINYMLGTQRNERLDNATREEFMRITRDTVTNPENGYKADYGEMRIFDLPIKSWRDIKMSCGEHRTTLFPFKKTVHADGYSENAVG